MTLPPVPEHEGEIWAWIEGQWKHLNGPQVAEETRSALDALLQLFSALETLDGIEAVSIAVPAPSERMDKAIASGYQAHVTLKAWLDEWEDELADYQYRIDEARAGLGLPDKGEALDDSEL